MNGTPECIVRCVGDELTISFMYIHVFMHLIHVCVTEPLPYVEGERVGVVPGLLHQGVVHDAQLGLVALRVDLDLLVPDVLPERQANHVQVLAAVAEGAGQLREHCHRQTSTKRAGDEEPWV